jgi:hypothetical protein
MVRKGWQLIDNPACPVMGVHVFWGLQGCRDGIGSMVAYQALVLCTRAPLLGLRRFFGSGVGCMLMQQHSCMGFGGNDFDASSDGVSSCMSGACMSPAVDLQLL